MGSFSNIFLGHIRKVGKIRVLCLRGRYIEVFLYHNILNGLYLHSFQCFSVSSDPDVLGPSKPLSGCTHRLWPWPLLLVPLLLNIMNTNQERRLSDTPSSFQLITTHTRTEFFLSLSTLEGNKVVSFLRLRILLHSFLVIFLLIWQISIWDQCWSA